jgi:hypothetical protein
MGQHLLGAAAPRLPFAPPPRAALRLLPRLLVVVGVGGGFMFTHPGACLIDIHRTYTQQGRVQDMQ